MPKVVGSVLAKVSIANDFSFYFLGEEKKSSVCVGAAWEGELTKRVIGTNNVRNSVALPCTAENVWIGRCNKRPKCGNPKKKTPNIGFSERWRRTQCRCIKPWIRGFLWVLQLKDAVASRMGVCS